MKEIITETLLDTLKLFPFLFVAFLLMELIEHKLSKKSRTKIEKSGKFGPLLGSLLGIVPQCGFSVMATNLYAARIITVGTLISIYLSTSDEMLFILISDGAKASVILKILLIKFFIGFIFGFLIDFVLRKRKKENKIEDFCLKENCDCKHGIVKSAFRHTLKIATFILIVTFVLNSLISALGEENISKLFLKDSFLSPFISSLIGLIPNCASSVILTELYLSNVISFHSCIAGLLTASGAALIVLFKVNNNKKENIMIVLTLYLIGALSGTLMKLIEMIF